MRATLSFLRGIAIALASTLLLFAVGECVARLGYSLLERQRTVDIRAESDAYDPGAQWVPAYFRELQAASKMRWEPYVYFRQRAFSGDYISIDARGVRKTWNAERPNGVGRRPFRIFFFGGSTMWGIGARDTYTIPSAVAYGLRERGYSNIEVLNYGETGYVAMQGYLTLLRELQRGERPDLVVFYDGVNDAYALQQSATLSVPLNEENRAREFLSLVSLERGRYSPALLHGLLSSSQFLRLIRAGYRRLFGIERIPGFRSDVLSGEQQTELLGRGVEAYMFVLKHVEVLGKHHGFQTLSYFQPHLGLKPKRSEFERAAAGRQDVPISQLLAFGAAVSTAVSRGHAPQSFTDISRLFEAESAAMFIDYCHLSERGNQVVARRMLADITALLSNAVGAEQ